MLMLLLFIHLATCSFVPNERVTLTEREFEEIKNYSLYAEEQNYLRDVFLKKHDFPQKNDEIRYSTQRGQKAVLKDVFFVVQIFTGESFCGGVAIGPRFILTSAHCLNHLNSSKLQLRIASVDLRGGQNIRLGKIILHSVRNYGEKLEACSPDDIAMLVTTDPIEKGMTIPLSKRSERAGERATFYGFGISSFKEAKPIIPDYMQRASVIVQRCKLTKHRHLLSTNGRFAAGDRGAALIWKEDGKPVVGGIFCGNYCEDGGRFSMFLRTTDYSDWIKDQMAIEMCLQI